MTFRQIDLSQISTTNSSNTQVLTVVSGNVTYTNTVSPFLLMGA